MFENKVLGNLAFVQFSTSVPEEKALIVRCLFLEKQLDDEGDNYNRIGEHEFDLADTEETGKPRKTWLSSSTKDCVDG
eukprot:CAMPEP_0195251462 /NCGR_PEP_ID=MMETSP0706-20130129/3295_1 /TAXON_ID=33640 /ORGANISM="Asterionellopsis glacialis, Strain CCMP134" /LENGTH=77 /DNA_ID=CAMNT_0040303599 /DNA_START=118 /DNA_END=352 /DNA_ORIENTATION=+